METRPVPKLLSRKRFIIILQLKLFYLKLFSRQKCTIQNYNINKKDSMPYLFKNDCLVETI